MTEAGATSPPSGWGRCPPAKQRGAGLELNLHSLVSWASTSQLVQEVQPLAYKLTGKADAVHP